jgi:hypothetical protein
MQENQEVCFWSVADGECAWMLQALVHSFHRVGMKGDFHVFCDRQIEGTIHHPIEKLDTRGFLFKITFLQHALKYLDYRYFVYFDSDTLFVRKPGPLLKAMHESSLHFFLESDLTQPVKRSHWWNCPIDNFIAMMRDCGVVSEKIYTLNSGFFIIRKEAIELACNLAMDFWKYALDKGYQFPDEPAWAYAMHLLCDDSGKHLLADSPDLWCSDWEGVFKGCLPDGKEWIFRDYMTGEPRTVNPAIIHALRSKEALKKLGVSVSEE